MSWLLSSFKPMY